VYATNTCPAAILPSNCFVGIHPTCFVVFFWSESMNARSSIVPGLIVIFTLGSGNRVGLVPMISFITAS